MTELARNGRRTVLFVDGWAARNGTPTANVQSITFSDGRRLFAGTSNTAAPAPPIP